MQCMHRKKTAFDAYRPSHGRRLHTNSPVVGSRWGYQSPGTPVPGEQFFAPRIKVLAVPSVTRMATLMPCAILLPHDGVSAVLIGAVPAAPAGQRGDGRLRHFR